MGRLDRAAGRRAQLTATPPRRTLVALLVPAVLLLPACSGVLGEPDAPVDQTAVQAPSELPVPVASGARVGASGTRNVLTGEPLPDGRVLAVTVDNTAAALPQAGLNQADLVYVAEVEEGATRLLALFQTELPDRVGPIGPARPGDAAVLASHGDVALAVAAGGGSDPAAEPTAEATTEPTSEPSGSAAAGPTLVSPTGGPEGFLRDPDRDAPHDLVGDAAALLARVPGSGQARDVGLRFGPVDGGSPTRAGEYRWPASAVEFAWSGDEDAWVQQRGGEAARDEAGEPVLADNVLFMAVPVEPDAYVDTDGARSPEVLPVGEGDVTLLRDGVAVPGTWSRGAAAEPTRFEAADGEDLLLDVGTTWVVLMTAGQAPTLTTG
ncbi:DUF3048 domain-containing protein [Jannaschia sp. R86511]|uniref:DUF3048 domain-containing protein n=1 Tax=Jannaschia sp. R86511 TaxID=3093853 RepID=UPI0036D28CCE